MTGFLFTVVTLLATENVNGFLGTNTLKHNSALYSYLDSLSNAAPAAPAPAAAAPASFGNYLSSLGSPEIPVQKVESKVVLVGKEEGSVPQGTGGYMASLGAAKPPRKEVGKKLPDSASSGGYLSQLAAPAAAAPVAATPEPVAAAPVAAAPVPVAASGGTSLAQGAAATYQATLNIGTPLAGGSSGPSGYLDTCNTGIARVGGAGLSSYLDTCNTGVARVGGAGIAGYIDTLSPKIESAAPVSYAPAQNVVVTESNDLASQRHGEIMKNLKIILSNQEEMKKDISQLLANSGLSSKAAYTPVSTPAAPVAAAEPVVAAAEPAAPVSSAPPTTGGYLSALGSDSGVFKGAKPIPKASSSGLGSYLSNL